VYIFVEKHAWISGQINIQGHYTMHDNRSVFFILFNILVIVSKGESCNKTHHLRLCWEFHCATETTL